MQNRRLRPWRAKVRGTLAPLALAAAFAITAATSAQAQGHITSPKEQFGHDIGDDYFLATYDQFSDYWHKLDRESDRMQVMEIGKTSEGRPHLAAIITAPENFAKLAHYKEISMRLAKGEGLTDDQAKALAKEGKAVVWIDGGLHATEVLGAHQLMETVYQLVSRNDEETRRILRDDIILAVHANPDGMQLVSSWYMQNSDTLERNTNIPRLYNKYAGHDDNRDSYMSNLAETQNLNHLMFWEWHPQIMYNHHQTGPAGAVMFSPPFRDPFNYHLDPMIVIGLDQVGSAMHQRFLAENKPGFTMRSGSSYSTWWNGGLRTIGYFQGVIGLLTETIGNPTPTRIPFVAAMQLPHGDLPAPIAPQEWHFRQSIDYSVTANYAVLDFASRTKDELLYDKYLMAKHAIEQGSHDSWTISGQRIAEMERALGQGVQQAGDRTGTRSGTRAGTPVGARAGRAGDFVVGGLPDFGQRNAAADAAALKAYNEVLHAPAKRDPRGYIIPSDQPDFPTATKFVNALRHVGVYVDRATAPFTVNGRRYPANSYVIRTAQAARSHVLDMMEPQDHPNDFAYPGGPPKRPYDNAGWTLAYQMGVKFDRLLDGFDAPTQRIEGLATAPAGTIAHQQGAAGYLLSHEYNDAFTVVNRVLKSGGAAYWLKSPLAANGRTYPAGTFYFAAGALPVVQASAADLGVSFEGTTARPGSDAVKLTPKRIALYDQYGGSMPSGWIRYEFEHFEFPYQVIYPQQLDAGDLRAKYDVIVFPSGATIHGGNLGVAAPDMRGRAGFGAPDPATIPAAYRPMLGQMTAEKTLPQIRKFLAEGGTVIAVGTATTLGYQLGLPIENHLVVRQPGEPDRALTGEEYYVPGSILRVAVDTAATAAAGLPSQLDVFFDNSPVFRLKPDAMLKGVRPVAWFDNAHPLRSGWAWGQNYLEGGVAAIEAKMGQGTVYLFGPEITFRGQPHGTFKLLFNGIYGR